MSIKPGKTVYTVNAETNTVDTWTCIGIFKGHFHGRKERLVMLSRGAENCCLPMRCVFNSKTKAMKIAEKDN